ncbi:MAG: hemolysin family protein [Pseudomonadota bacterium]|nr:hemolysin family protein [Pseudomonadota bacterium]
MDDRIEENTAHAEGVSRKKTKRKKNFWKFFFGGGDAAPEASNQLQEKTDNNEVDTREILVNLRNLQNLRLDDISVPKADIIALAEDASFKDVIEVFRSSGFTRVPVFSDTLDNPLGLIHLKDLALSHGFGAKKKFNLKSVLRPLIYVPPSMTIGTLLQRMQAERIHMALVIDEYGGVEGLVTIEDLLEQIVGDIIDEHDVEGDKLWVEERPGVYLVDARLDLEDFFDETGFDLRHSDAEDEYDTVGGLVFALTNRIPVRGEVVNDQSGNEFSVIDADPRSIKRIRLNLSEGRKKATNSK